MNSSTTGETLFCCICFAAAALFGLDRLIAQPAPAPDLYRFSTIRVAKGTIVETLDGKYIALKDEVWIHEEQYLNMQKEKARVTEMLVQAQRRR